MKDTIFNGEVFCLSGTMSMTRKEIKELIEKNGGTVSNSMSKSVEYLITTREDYDSHSTKVSKALQYHIPILNEDFIHECVEQEKFVSVADFLLDTTTTTTSKKNTSRSDLKRKANSSDTSSSSSSSFTSKAKKARVVKKDEEPEDEDEEEKEEEEEEKEVTKKVKVVATGKYVVDPSSGLSGKGKIYVEGDTAYTCMLNQTDVKYGQRGHNKFYSIQLIEDGSNYYVFTKWGRVGANGQKKLEDCSSLNEAKNNFTEKFRKKTKNAWSDRDNFQPFKGSYVMIELDYDDDDNDKGDSKEDSSKSLAIPECTLDSRLQHLIGMISNKQMMAETMREFEIDLKKMPLGKISKKQISLGYEILKQIQDVLDGKSDDDVDELSSDFYSNIPHDFGHKRPIPINSETILKRKMQMLETLADLEIATTLLSKGSHLKHPLDSAYESLKTDIKPLDKNSEEYKLCVEYVNTTHAPTHSNYSLEVEDVFRIAREGEEQRYHSFINEHKIGNRRLLWHGSRLTNFMGILSNGLKIAPPEAPATGYMFGKGVYLADMVSKSANYCFTNPSNNVGCILLADAALGKMYERLHAEYMLQPPSGFQSTWGKGKTVPDQSMWKKLEDTTIPVGKPTQKGGCGSSGSLLYNEFIVYNTSQLQLKYLIILKFNYKTKW